MDGESSKTCPSCGKAAKEGASFCTACGAGLTLAEGPRGPENAAAAPPPAYPAGVAPPPGAPPPPPGTGEFAAAQVPVAPPAAAGGKRSKVPLILGICGGALVVACAVVLLLGFAVGPKWFAGGGKGGGGSSDPLALAQKYMDALMAGDLDAYMDCFEEDFFLNEMKNNPFLEELGMSEEDVKEFARMAFEMMEVEFKGVELEVQSESGDMATVVTTAGSMKVSVFGMGEEVDLAEDPLEFRMAKKGGRWYLTENPMEAAMGTDMDMEDLDLEDLNLEDLFPEDMDIEDLEDLLPEDLDLEDLENKTPQELEELLEQLEKLMQELPEEESGGSV